MAFAAGDQKRIADVLKLAPEQYWDKSTLATLMEDLELNDTEYSTAHVTSVIEALDAIDTLDTSIAANSSNDSLSSLSITNQYSKTYRTGGGATASLKADKAGHIDTIKRLLDPDSHLERFSYTSRVIRTL